MPKDCQMKDCKWYNALNYPHSQLSKGICSPEDFIPPLDCGICSRFYGDKYSPKQCEEPA